MASEEPAPDRPALLLAGAARVRLGGAEHMLEPKDALALAWLAVEGPTPRARLAALLFPDVDEARSRNALRQRLFQLKRRLGTEVVTGGGVLQLEPALAVDIEAEAELLAGVIADDLEELGGWLATQRGLRHTRRSEALAAAAESAEAEGRFAEALEHATALLALQPESEHAFRRVMRLHYRRGDRAAAITAYERCRDLLRRELRVEPSAETEALRRQVEAQTAAALPTRTVPVTLLRPPRLIGRDAEWAALNEVWRARAAAIVVGEPGMGKTRLLSDLFVAHGNGVLATGRPGDLRVPYALLSRLVRALVQHIGNGLSSGVRKELARLLPEFNEPEPMKTDADRVRFVNALESLLAMAARRGVAGIAVDDLQFADAASIETLQYLAGAEASLTWLTAYRPGELAQEGRALLGELTRARRAVEVRLTPLTEGAVAELIESLDVGTSRGSSLAPQVARHTGGNPLYVLETLKAMLSQGTAATSPEDAGAPWRLPVATSVTVLIERHIGQLSADAVKLARCAAIAGQDFSADLATHVLGANALDLADAWNELERVQVFRDGTFVHDLMYEAALASVPTAIARHLHGEVGRYLRGCGAPTARAAVHLDAADLGTEAAPLWEAAGDTAAAARRFVEAAADYERAAELYERGALTSEGFKAALKMRKVCQEIDLRDQSERALQLLDQFALTPVQTAWAENERAVTCLMRGDLPATERHAQAGLRKLGGADQPLLRAELRRNLAAVLTWKGESSLALNELRSIQADIERLGTPAQRFDLVQSLAIVLDHNDQTEEAIERNREGIELGLAIGDVAGAAQCALNLVLSQHDIGDLCAAQNSLARARTLLHALPDSKRSYSSLELNSGLVARGLGDYAQALEHFDRAIERAHEQTPGWLPLMVAHRVQTLIFLGQMARAQRELDGHQPVAATPPLAVARWRATRADLNRLLGRATADELDDVIMAQPPRGRPLSRWRLEAVRLALPGDPHARLADAESMLPALTTSGRLGLAISVRTRAAELALRAGATVAAEHARRALHLLRTRQPDNLYIGEVWLAAFRALRDSDPTTAEQALSQAVDWVFKTAQQSVPAEYRDSFLNRNPVNRALLTLATRHS